jgi:GNAT superfamily N-acetyltransferase
MEKGLSTLVEGVLTEAASVGLADGSVRYYRSCCHVVVGFCDGRGIGRLTEQAMEEILAGGRRPGTKGVGVRADRRQRGLGRAMTTALEAVTRRAYDLVASEPPTWQPTSTPRAVGSSGGVLPLR